MTRKEILDTAAKCVCGDREQDYGSPENNFQTIAKMWDAYLKGGKKTAIDAVDVAAMLAMLKIARIASGHAKEDNWVDLAGYAACGGEIQSTVEQSRKMSQSDLNRSQSPKKPPLKSTVKEFHPCCVWVYEDNSWAWDLQPTFGPPFAMKHIVARYLDCTVQVLETEDGSKKSLGWWRDEMPPVKCCGAEVDDNDCN